MRCFYFQLKLLYHELLPDAQELLSESRFLQEELTGIDGLAIERAGTNFFLCALSDGRTASELQRYLIAEHGLLIRHAGNFRGLGEEHFRLAAQNREYNIRLIQALQSWRSLPH